MGDFGTVVDSTDDRYGAQMKVWFITGTSRGFGNVWTQAALQRGDKVVATARDLAPLQPLVEEHGEAILPLQLDVSDRVAAFEAVATAHAHFGRLDVVVNNAGFGHMGYVEELTEHEIRAQFDTNVFGAIWVTQAALPFLRAQGSGHLVQVSSASGLTAAGGMGLYSASKWALEGLSEALAQEVRKFGVSVTLIEPGGYATGFGSTGRRNSEMHDDYIASHEKLVKLLGTASSSDAKDSIPALFAVVDAEKPPVRLLLGDQAVDIVTSAYERRLSDWKAWEEVSRSAG